LSWGRLSPFSLKKYNFKKMGFYNILFGGSDKPRVTEKEYRKAKGELYDEGFSKQQRARIDEIFGSDYNMSGTDSHPRGLEDAEITAHIKWMREHKSECHFDDAQIDKIEASLRKRL
jgi:hypothetical protein